MFYNSFCRISGRMTIQIADGKHSYQFEYLVTG